MADISQIIIGDVKYPVKANKIYYGTCSTAAAAKVVTISNSTFVLETGSIIAVIFTTSNTGALADLTLNVNGTGAKAIKMRNKTLSSGFFETNVVYLFVYDGTDWEIINDKNTDVHINAITKSIQLDQDFPIVMLTTSSSEIAENLASAQEAAGSHASSVSISTIDTAYVQPTVAVNPSTGQLKASSVNATTRIITPEVYNTSLSIQADVGSGHLTLSGHHIFLSAGTGGMVINGGGAANGIKITNTSGPISLSTSSSTISITSSKGSVDVQGSTWSSTSGTNACINSSGKLCKQSSSLRYKTNVDYDVDTEHFHEVLMNLKPCTYEYKEVPDEQNLGLIAEDIFELDAQLLNYDDDFEIESYRDKDMLTVLIIEAQNKDKVIKDLKEKINDLEERLQTIEQLSQE